MGGSVTTERQSLSGSQKLLLPVFFEQFEPAFHFRTVELILLSCCSSWFGRDRWLPWTTWTLLGQYFG